VLGGTGAPTEQGQHGKTSWAVSLKARTPGTLGGTETSGPAAKNISQIGTQANQGKRNQLLF
jgi:hypothetical protein